MFISDKRPASLSQLTASDTVQFSKLYKDAEKDTISVLTVLEIMIARMLKSIKNADCNLVIEAGKLVNSGKNSEKTSNY